MITFPIATGFIHDADEFARAAAEKLTDISAGQAIVISLLGIAIVFVALSVIVAIIKAISAIARAADNRNAAPVAVPVAAAPVAPLVPGIPAGMVPAKGSLGEVALYDTDPRDAAMIMAIVADELKAPLNELRFISIKSK